MRASRLIPALTAMLGAGLVSGSLAQVAALDGNLERAAFQQQQQREPIERVDHLVVVKRCDRDRRPPAAWRES